MWTKVHKVQPKSGDPQLLGCYGLYLWDALDSRGRRSQGPSEVSAGNSWPRRYGYEDVANATLPDTVT